MPPRRDSDDPLQLLATLNEYQAQLEGSSPPPGTRKRRDSAAIALAMAILREVRAGRAVVLEPAGSGGEAGGGPPLSPTPLHRARQVSIGPDARLTRSIDRSIPPIDIEAELSLLGAPPDDEPETPEQVRRALERVLGIMDSEDAWPNLHRDTQHALISHLTARLRWIQEELLEGQADRSTDARIAAALRRLSTYCKREEPGFVHGLARTAEPRYGTWFQDTHVTWEVLSEQVEREVGTRNPERALQQLEEANPAGMSPVELQRQVRRVLNAGVSPDDPRLIRLLEGRAEDLEGRFFKRLRKNIRGWESEDQSTEEEESSSRIPDDWPWWPLVEGKHVIMVGGDLRADARDRLQADFRLASLEWVRADKLGPIQDIARKVLRHGVDQLWILRSFVSHKIDEILLPACRKAGVPWVHVERGYGTTQVRLSIERFLTDPRQAEDDA